MVKHNNVVPNNHFRKDWQRFVKTWFDQPAKASARRAARLAKAKRVYPRPVNALRPVVRAPTVKYNTKIRAGRGFTLEELRAAKVVPKAAAGLGIAVDHRRKNRSEEAFRINVDRLTKYTEKLVVFPRRNNNLKAGDAKKEERAAVQQVTTKMVVPLPTISKKEKARAITEKEANAPRSVFNVLKRAAVSAKLWGKREKAAVKLAASKAAADKKAAKADANA